MKKVCHLASFQPSKILFFCEIIIPSVCFQVHMITSSTHNYLYYAQNLLYSTKPKFNLTQKRTPCPESVSVIISACWRC
jgi:hypothetical protein